METGRKNIYSGKISYEPFWTTIKKKGIRKIDLRSKEFNLSPTLINKLKNNGNITTDTIAYLCYKLSCKIEDIVKYIPIEKKD